MRVAPLIVVAALAVLPASARADDPCAGDAAQLSGLCSGDRPYPQIGATPTAPRVGSPVVLTVMSGGRAVTYAWDLDGDGSFDDATGKTATTTFAGGTPTVGVRATDDAGRSGTEIRTFALHAFNTRPSGTLKLTPASARARQPVTVQADGYDPDGQIAKVELDLDGDGTYETTGAEHTATFASTGTRTLRARFTDDAGGSAVTTATLDVHTQNLAPRASFQLSQANGSSTSGAPLVAGGATVTAYASDPDGTVAGFDFDLDGDGSYETHADPGDLYPPGVGGTVKTSFAAGEHEIGVRVTDSEGATAVVRRSVLAVPEWPVAGAHAPPVVLDFAGMVARPGVPATLSASNLEPGGTFAWDADGDGSFDDGSGRQVQFTYPVAGEYTVRVKASGPGGERIAMATVSVRDAPALPPVLGPLRLPRALRAGQPVAFDAAGSSVDGLPAGIALTFDLDGDGQFDDVPSGAFGYSWTFDDPAEIAVKATDGAARTAVRTAEVAPAPGNLGPLPSFFSLPSGFPGPSAQGEPMFLAGKTLTLGGFGDDVDGGGCCTFAWDADGDGDYDDGTGSTLIRSFSPGEHTLGLRATDADGASARVRQTFTAGSHPPRASFSVSGSTVTSTATDPDGDAIASVEWDLDGDRAFDDATGESARALEGEHLVGVRVRDASGEVGIAYAKVTGEALPAGTPTPAPHGDSRVSPPVARDTVAPTLTATPKAPRLAELLKRGLPVALRCSEACRVTVAATVVRADAKRLRLGGSLDVAHSTRALAAGVKATVTLRLSPKAQRALKKARTLRLTVTTTAVDAAGNRTASRRTVRIRR